MTRRSGRAARVGAIGLASVGVALAALAVGLGPSPGPTAATRGTPGTTATTTTSAEVASPAAGPPPPASPDAAAPAGRGSIHERVDAPPGISTRPVGIDDVAEFGNGVQARLAAVEPIDAQGHLPGERSGPAVAITLQVTNGSSAAIDLGTVTVDLTIGAGAGVPAYAVAVPERPPLGGTLAVGAATSGEYVFTLAPEERAHVQVHVKYSADTPTVVFEGSVADG
jgi:hypothetical protein